MNQQNFLVSIIFSTIWSLVVICAQVNLAKFMASMLINPTTHPKQRLVKCRKSGKKNEQKSIKQHQVNPHSIGNEGRNSEQNHTIFNLFFNKIEKNYITLNFIYYI